MRLREAVASALHLLVVLAFFSLAFLSLFLARRADWMQTALDRLNNAPETLYWMAAGFGAIALFFLWGFHGIGRGRYLALEMPSGKAMIDSKLVRQAIEECFRKNYPGQVAGASVSVAKNKRLEVSLDLVPLPEGRQLELLSDAEEKLRELLQSQFGYQESLALFVRSRDMR